ncbi:MAG: GNAT family N-acetyltransferase [Luteimonas sp.]
MTTIIRRATLDDLDTLAPLFDAYRQFYLQPADLQRAHDWLRARLQGGDSVVLLAERDCVGIGFTQLYATFSSVRTGRLWTLNDLFVREDARREGVARALLDAAVRFACDDGATGIQLETSCDNAAARALYRAAGWNEDASQWYSLALSSSMVDAVG